MKRSANAHEAPGARPKKPRKRRDPRRERNRKRLIDAAIQVLLGEGGPTKFSSAHIADVAGLRKPAFYAHFQNTDDCMRAVVAELARPDVRELIDMYREASPSGSLELTGRLNERALQNVRRDPLIYRLLLRHRFSEGALGEGIRDIYNAILQLWVEHLWRLAVQYKIDARHFREIEQLAEFQLNMLYTAFDRVVTGRASDVRAEAVRLARYQYSLGEAEFRRILSEAPAEKP